MRLRGLAYRLYERRLEAALAPQAIPRHVGVMCDGNRRWALSAGLKNVSSLPHTITPIQRLSETAATTPSAPQLMVT